MNGAPNNGVVRRPAPAVGARWAFRTNFQHSARNLQPSNVKRCGSAVCKQIDGLPDKMANDRRLRRQIERIDITLTQAKATWENASTHAQQ